MVGTNERQVITQLREGAARYRHFQRTQDYPRTAQFFSITVHVLKASLDQIKWALHARSYWIAQSSGHSLPVSRLLDLFDRELARRTKGETDIWKNVYNVPPPSATDPDLCRTYQGDKCAYFPPYDFGTAYVAELTQRRSSSSGFTPQMVMQALKQATDDQLYSELDRRVHSVLRVRQVSEALGEMRT